MHFSLVGASKTHLEKIKDSHPLKKYKPYSNDKDENHKREGSSPVLKVAEQPQSCLRGNLSVCLLMTHLSADCCWGLLIYSL